MEVCLGVTVDHRDALSGKESGHRRVDILIGAGDFETFILHGPGHGGHGGAANPNKVNRFYPGEHRPTVVGAGPGACKPNLDLANASRRDASSAAHKMGALRESPREKRGVITPLN